MRYLKHREQIATAINFGKYPVLRLDLSNRPAQSYATDSDFCVGDRVRVAWDKPGYEGMTTRGNVYFEGGRYAIDQGGSVLKNSFGRHDIIEDYEWSYAPLVHAGQEVVLIIDNPIEKKCAVALMRVSAHIDIHCPTVAYLEELEEELWKED